MESDEGIKFAELDADKTLNFTSIFVDENKLDMDIEIPFLSPRIFIREVLLIDAGIDKLPSLGLKLENKILETEYVAIDMLEGNEVIRRKWDLPVPQDSKSVIAYYTDQIIKQLKMTRSFATFYPLVKEYVIEKLFSKRVDLDDPRVLYQLSSPDVQNKLIKLFVEHFKDMTFIEEEPKKLDFIKLSHVRPFPWSKLVYPANKCIFNYVPCDNNFEVDFAKFLDRAEDVTAFSKITPKMKFFVEYRDSNGNLRLYYPDFIMLTDDNKHYIIETKGRVDVDVKYKDRRIKQWCEDASRLTDNIWAFIRVNQEDFEKYKFKSIQELLYTF